MIRIVAPATLTDWIKDDTTVGEEGDRRCGDPNLSDVGEPTTARRAAPRTRLCAPIVEPWPVHRCSAIAACPPTCTKSPSTVEPAMPTCAAIAQHQPRRTFCPICTRLSRRDPAPI